MKKLIVLLLLLLLTFILGWQYLINTDIAKRQQIVHQEEHEAAKHVPDGNEEAMSGQMPSSDPSPDEDFSELMKERPNDLILGNREAGVKIVEYSSLACPHCAEYHNDSFKHIKAEYIDKGLVEYIYRDFPSTQSSLVGVMISRCDLPKRAEWLDIFFKTHETWAFSQNFLALMKNTAKLGGMSEEDFQKCIEDKAMKDKILQEAYNAVHDDKITGTPAMFINGKQFKQWHNYEYFLEHIEKEIAKAKKVENEQ
jgi:protein-disulfide isomerase